MYKRQEDYRPPTRDDDDDDYWYDDDDDDDDYSPPTRQPTYQPTYQPTDKPVQDCANRGDDCDSSSECCGSRACYERRGNEAYGTCESSCPDDDEYACRSEDAKPAYQPTRKPTGGSGDGSCVNDNSSKDNAGDDCSWYDKYAEETDSCGDHDDSDFKAKEQCCACGGGDRGGGSSCDTVTVSGSNYQGSRHGTYKKAGTCKSLPYYACEDCSNDDIQYLWYVHDEDDNDYRHWPVSYTHLRAHETS